MPSNILWLGFQVFICVSRQFNLTSAPVIQMPNSVTKMVHKRCRNLQIYQREQRHDEFKLFWQAGNTITQWEKSDEAQLEISNIGRTDSELWYKYPLSLPIRKAYNTAILLPYSRMFFSDDNNNWSLMSQHSPQLEFYKRRLHLAVLDRQDRDIRNNVTGRLCYPIDYDWVNMITRVHTHQCSMELGFDMACQETQQLLRCIHILSSLLPQLAKKMKDWQRPHLSAVMLIAYAAVQMLDAKYAKHARTITDTH
ncbi:hypothetical protein BDZ97DRAFT_1766289 [Flammula alnicola]|nr:hypothetical protein BDZ97DRAFT_1766289 [Flammula alnicola]